MMDSDYIFQNMLSITKLNHLWELPAIIHDDNYETAIQRRAQSSHIQEAMLEAALGRWKAWGYQIYTYRGYWSVYFQNELVFSFDEFFPNKIALIDNICKWDWEKRCA